MALKPRLDEVCDRHTLELVEVYASKHDRIVALVQDTSGRRQLLKITGSPYRNQREQALCEAWAAHGLSPAGVLIEPDTLLRGWVDGPLLDELSCRGASRLYEVGALLARAHASASGFPFPAMSEFLKARLESHLAKSLSPAHRRFIAEVAGRAIAVSDDGALAHGDTAPCNMFAASGALSLIDGRGHRGGAALDVADYAVRVHAGSPLEHIGELVAGYGHAPAGLADQLAWLLATDCVWHPRSDQQAALGEQTIARGAGRVHELAGYWC